MATKNLKRLFFILFLAASTVANAQTDSIAFVSGKWEKIKIAPGIKLKKQRFENNLFSSNQNISILEIKQRKRNFLTLAFERSKRVKTSDFGKRENAIAAINGTFFDVKNGGSVDFLKVNREVINQNRLTNNTRAIHQKAAIAISNGRLKILEWDGSDTWENKLPEEEVMLSGPLLIIDGKEEELDTTAFVKLRHPRSAISAKRNKVYFITADGRSANAAGLSLTELTKILTWLKMDAAINLDGGGSTALWVKNRPDNGIINYPSDNKKWDHEGERTVANAVLVKKRSR